MGRPRVLFLCVGNACRSPMAAAWLAHLAGDRFEAVSAGIAPIRRHPLTERVMREAGVDLGAPRTRYVGDALAEGADLLVALSSTALRGCPPLPPRQWVVHWPTADPYGASGSEEEVLAVFRGVRDLLRERLERWLAAGAPPLGRDRAAPPLAPGGGGR